jgi:glyoxylate reductase
MLLQFGSFPASEELKQRLYNEVGTVLRFESPEAFLAGPTDTQKLEITGLLCGIHHQVPVTLLDRLPKLKVISNFGAGTDNLPVAEAKARGITVCNTPDLLAEATADLTLALILSVHRRLRESETYLRAGQFTGWQPDLLLGRDLSGQTLGLVGCGGIGQAVAKRAKAFGLKVLYTQRKQHPEALEAELSVSYRGLEALLKQSDLVSLHCPLTVETRHLINAQSLKLMKPGSVLINTSRGAVVDEDALVAALKQGHLWGAGLDVFEQEPQVHPELLDLPNVTLLPHIGSATQATRQAMGDRAIENLLLVLAGQAPITAV